MAKQIRTYVKHCLICASVKTGGAAQARAPLRPHIPQRPWQVISMDVMGPYPVTRTGNRFLLVATDIQSKWVEAIATAEAGSYEVTNFLETICRRWGYAEEVITDNGPCFRGNIWERYLRLHGIRAYTVPIYHQRANPVERRNQELKKLLRLRQRDPPTDRWDEDLDQMLFTLRTRENTATGMTPSELLLGATLVRPGEWNHPAVNRPVANTPEAREQRIERARRRQAVFTRNLYPQPRTAPIVFQVGERVLVRNFPGVREPLGVTCVGPHPIMAVRGEGIYEVDRNGSQVKIHIDDLRPWEGGPQLRMPDQDPMGVDPSEREVEAEDSNESPEREVEAEDSNESPEREREAEDNDPQSEEEVEAEENRRHESTLELIERMPDIEDVGEEVEAGAPEVDAIPIVGLYP